jgi:O-antigen/teichoic acid export membrane protein
MSGIRVAYSGLISFAVGLTSVITGIIFTLIVTRSLTTEEFGTWNLIGGLIIYVIIAEPIISYWTTREMARGIESAKTAVISSGIFSIGGVAVYLLISFSLSNQLHANQSVLYFASILIPVMFLNRTLTAINLGWKPQASSYGMLSFEVSKIPVALILVHFLHMGIFGAILSTIIAYIASIIILGIFAREKLKSQFNKSFLKKWMKLSWLSAYPGLSNIIYHLDVIVFSVISGSVIGLAFYSAAQSVSNLVGNSSLIAQAVYPKLLEGGSKQHLKENLTRFFYFAFPLAALAIVFAKPALFALKPVYDIAVPVVIFMTIRAFLYVLGGIYNQALMGIETVDLNEHSTVKDFIKSKLFFVPTSILVQYSVYIISVTIGLFFLKPYSKTNVDLVTYWAVISLVTQIPFTIYYYISTKKHFVSSIDWESVIKYFGSSIVSFGITYILLQEFLSYKNSIFEFIPNLFLFALVGIGLYFLMTYIIDHKTRKLLQAIIKEMKKNSI